MDKQKLLEILRENGAQIAYRSIRIGLIFCTIHLFENYQILLSEGEVIWEELVGGVVWSIFLMVYYFVATVFLEVNIMSNKK